MMIRLALATTMALTTCGIALAAPPSKCHMLPGMDFVGEATKRVASASDAACCTLCLNDKGCSHWTRNASRPKYTCEFKPAGSKPTKRAGCSSGTTGPAPPGPPPRPPPPPPPPLTGLTISDMFHGGAVLQRGQHVSVWGTSLEKSVTLVLGAGAQAVTVVAAVNASSTWMAFVPPQVRVLLLLLLLLLPVPPVLLVLVVVLPLLPLTMLLLIPSSPPTTARCASPTPPTGIYLRISAPAVDINSLSNCMAWY